jgi:hypothetical protein
VVSKATLADAFAVALRRTNRAVVKLKSAKTDNGKPKAPAEGGE